MRRGTLVVGVLVALVLLPMWYVGLQGEPAEEEIEIDPSVTQIRPLGGPIDAPNKLSPSQVGVIVWVALFGMYGALVGAHRFMNSAVRPPDADAEVMASDGGEPRSDAGEPRSDGSKPKSDAGEPRSDGSKPKSDAGEPRSDGSKPRSDGSKLRSNGGEPTDANPTPGDGRPTPENPASPEERTDGGVSGLSWLSTDDRWLVEYHDATGSNAGIIVMAALTVLAIVFSTLFTAEYLTLARTQYFGLYATGLFLSLAALTIAYYAWFMPQVKVAEKREH